MNNKRRLSKKFTREFLVEQYTVLRKTIYCIAIENETTRESVSKQLHAFGIPVYSYEERQKLVDSVLTKEYLEEHYVKLKKSATKIHEETGIDRHAIQKRLIKHGIPIRNKCAGGRRDMLGRVFGRLKVIEFSHINERQVAVWKCLCKCGKILKISGQTLRNKKNGGSKICGCIPYRRKYRDIPGSVWGKIKHGALTRCIPLNITPEFVEDLFVRQNGICALSGRKISFYPINAPTASLDRIDSTKPYDPENVQWVHKHVNMMKQTLSQDEFIGICYEIAMHHPEYINRINKSHEIPTYTAV